MKFVNTICWDIINADEILRISYEEHQDKLYSYFILKNGEKRDAFETLDSFNIHDEKEYWFDAQCHNSMNLIILKMIMDMDENSILDIEKEDELLWKNFLFWADNNKHKLRERTKK